MLPLINKGNFIVNIYSKNKTQFTFSSQFSEHKKGILQYIK